MENIVIMNSGTVVLPEMFPEHICKSINGRSLYGTITQALESVVQHPQDEPGVSQHGKISTPAQIRPLREIEKLAIEEAIRICKNNVPLAAVQLGVSPSTLYRKLKYWDNS